MQERTSLEDSLTAIGRIEREVEDQVTMIELGDAENDAADRCELVLERGALLHHALRALLIVPQARVLGLLVELLETLARLVEVKDASSAARATA